MKKTRLSLVDTANAYRHVVYFHEIGIDFSFD